MKNLFVFIFLMCFLTLFFNTEVKAKDTSIPTSDESKPPQDLDLEEEVCYLNESIDFVKSDKSRLFNKKDKPTFIRKLESTSSKLKHMHNMQIILSKQGQEATLRLNGTLKRYVSSNSPVTKRDKETLIKVMISIDKEYPSGSKSTSTPKPKPKPIGNQNCSYERVTVTLTGCNKSTTLKLNGSKSLRPIGNNTYVGSLCPANYKVSLNKNPKVCKVIEVKKPTVWQKIRCTFLGRCPNKFIVNLNKSCSC